METIEFIMVFISSPTSYILTNVKEGTLFVWGGPPTLSRVEHCNTLYSVYYLPYPYSIYHIVHSVYVVFWGPTWS